MDGPRSRLNVNAESVWSCWVSSGLVWVESRPELRLPRAGLQLMPVGSVCERVSSSSSVSRRGSELHFCLWLAGACSQTGLHRPASSTLTRGGFGGGRNRFCSLLELCSRRLWPSFRNVRSPKLSECPLVPMWERWRKSPWGRLIMLTDKTSFRLDGLLCQRPDVGLRSNDVLKGILRLQQSDRMWGASAGGREIGSGTDYRNKSLNLTIIVVKLPDGYIQFKK